MRIRAASRRRKASAVPHRHRTDIPTRHWTVLAQDPGMLGPRGTAITTTVEVPAERLERGPKGHRVHVVDYDGSADLFYGSRADSPEKDFYVNVTDVDRLVRDPHFHQQNVYAIAMSTLFEFERALGRGVDWGFKDPSHQLKIAPHAFLDGNAFYSRDSESLNFGYFPGFEGKRVYTCLSHDIVVHETTHALLDGMRTMYLKPSSPDQAGFHEGFSDIVALLSVFSHREVIELALGSIADSKGRIPARLITAEKLGGTALLTLAEEMGSALEGVRGSALRHSVTIRPDRRHYSSERFAEEHDRGELLVAVVLRTFLRIWVTRLMPLIESSRSSLLRAVVAEEGGTAAGHLRSIVIRALDYLPPVDLTYPDYLSALLTADEQLYPDDTKYGYREALRTEFESFGIIPASRARADGCWDTPPQTFTLAGLHFERMQHDPASIFRFVWENRDALGIYPDAFTRVTSVRPVMRVSRDGTVLRETVAEYVQTLRVYSPELKTLGIRTPAGMRRSRLITLYGGGTLIFNEYGQLKFHVGTGVTSRHQTARLQSLWDNGFFDEAVTPTARILRMHRRRALRPLIEPCEDW